MAFTFSQRSLLRERQLQCFRLYQENAFAYACVELLKSQLIESGFTISRGASPATDEFQEFVDLHYGSFARDCLESILLYGFVAWDVQKIEKNQAVPFVVPGTHVIVHMTSGEAGEVLYTGMSVMTGRQTTGFKMVDHPDLINMRIESSFTKIIPYHIFETVLVQNAIQADRRAAETPMVLENLSSVTSDWAMRDFDVSGDPDVNMDSTWKKSGEYLSGRMGAISESLIRLQDHYVKSLNTIGELDAVHQSSVFSKSKDEQIPKMQLPPHTRVARVDFPHTRQDLREILRLNAHRICVCLGVPYETIVRDLPIRVDSQATASALQERIRTFQKLISPILTEALNFCTKTSSAILYAATQDERYVQTISIQFNGSVPTTNELIALYEKGLLPKAFIQKHLASKYNFDPDEYGAGGDGDAPPVGAPEEE